jgi:NitT/TauT family transport system ATP-binding protein
VLIVTHNIEEAVLMCDRILVLASNPGHIAAEIPVPLPQPRDRLDAAFHNVVDEIHSILTSRMTESIGAQARIHGGLVQILPQVSTSRIGGFVETLASPGYGGHAELADIARALALEINELFPIAEALQILEFAELKEGAVKLTAAGRVFAQSDIGERKRLFGSTCSASCRSPLISAMCSTSGGITAPRARFEFELEDHLNRNDAEKTLRAAIAWGRYAELFTYDDKTRMFGLDHFEP